MTQSRASALAAVSLAAVFGLTGCNDRDVGAALGAAAGAVVGGRLSEQTYGRPGGYAPPRDYGPPPCRTVPVVTYDRNGYPHTRYERDCPPPPRY